MPYRFLFLFLFLPCLLHAQSGLRGYTRNTKGEAVPFVSIYVKNSQTGTVSNENAQYELRLPAGNYQIVFQEIGHKTIEKEVTVGEGFATLDIALEAQSFQLKEVSLSTKNEDPAYTIMRKAIAMSKIHKLQVDSYQARLYIKGTGRILGIPDIVEKKIAKEGVKEGKTFLNESITDLQFEQPNKYTQNVLSTRSSEMDNNSVSPMDFVQGSFYDPMLNGIISPLSPSAFAYYRFALESTFKDQGYEVSKIKVTPRSKGDDVWDGFIYIVEDLWAIHSVQLKTTKLGFGVQVQQTLSPVEQGVFMPITHQFKIEGKFLGFKMEYNYIVSVSDYKVKVNPKYNHEFKLIDEKIEKERAKDARKNQQAKGKAGKEQDLETALMNGEELTRKNLRKLIKDAEKKQLEEERKQTKKGEVPESALVKNETTKIDTLAKKRGKDDDFWEKNRGVPLAEHELKAYQERDSTFKADSVKRSKEVTDSTTKKTIKVKKFRIWDVVLGGNYKVGKGSTFTITPLYEQINYNTVESLVGNYKLAYRRSRKKASFQMTTWARYSVGREMLTGKGEMAWTLNRHYKYDTTRRRQVRWTLDGGRFVEQYNAEYPIPTFLNTAYTLLFERNFMKLYERDYARLRWNAPLHEALTIDASVEYARRRALDNTTDYTFFNYRNQALTSNTPENLETSEVAFSDYNALVGQAKLTYRPSLRYGMRNGRKYLVTENAPVLTLDYRKGMGDVNYDFLALGIQHQFKWGIRSTVGYAFSGGMFLNKERLYFPDYKHFNGNRMFVQFADAVSSFRLLDYYRYSTADKYVEGHAYIKFRKLALTQITYLRTFGIKENIFVNQLLTPKVSYTEVGYTLDNVLRIFRLEGVTSFENGRYRGWGVRVGITTTLGFVNVD